MKFARRLELYIFILILLLSIAIRFYKLSEDPPGLYQDEVAIGYNAYTILKTGKDEYGVPFPLLFRSFDDYKLPVYIYTTAFSELIFGKNEFAVRFPSAISGVLTIVVLYLILKELSFTAESKKKQYRYIPLLASTLLTFSPWHIQFSRAGFEVNMGLFLYLVGWYFAVKYFNKSTTTFICCSILFFILSVYTYHSFSLISPLTLFALLLIFYKSTSNKKQLLIFSVVSVFALMPFIFAFLNHGQTRFQQVGIFNSYKNNSPIEKMLIYPISILKSYISFFSVQFLFNNGDGFGRHQIPGFGLIPKWEIVFLITGIITFLKRKKQKLLNFFVFFTLGISVLPGALSSPAPHTLRSLLMVIPLCIFISYGIIFFLGPGIMRKLLLLFIFVICIFETLTYFHYYYGHYPKTNIPDWGGGYKEIIQYTTSQKGYDVIAVDKRFNFAPIYFKFYSSESQHLLMVDSMWIKPRQYEGKKILFIRFHQTQSYDKTPMKELILPNINKDIYVEFYSL